MMLSQTFLTFGFSQCTATFPSLVADVSAAAEYNNQNAKYNTNTNGNVFQDFISGCRCLRRTFFVSGCFYFLLCSQVYSGKGFSIHGKHNGT